MTSARADELVLPEMGPVTRRSEHPMRPRTFRRTAVHRTTSNAFLFSFSVFSVHLV